jgi:hypothetical protein
MLICDCAKGVEAYHSIHPVKKGSLQESNAKSISREQLCTMLTRVITRINASNQVCKESKVRRRFMGFVEYSTVSMSGIDVQRLIGDDLGTE